MRCQTVSCVRAVGTHHVAAIRVREWKDWPDFLGGCESCVVSLLHPREGNHSSDTSCDFCRKTEGVRVIVQGRENMKCSGVLRFSNGCPGRERLGFVTGLGEDMLGLVPCVEELPPGLVATE